MIEVVSIGTTKAQDKRIRAAIKASGGTDIVVGDLAQIVP